MPFLPGDPVHVASLGKGVVREVRNGDRYLIELKGRSLVANAAQLTPVETSRKSAGSKRPAVNTPPREYAPPEGAPSIDLHGRTVAEALEAVSAFLNDALLAGRSEVHIIHGRSGGRIKAALHAQLARISSIRDFRVDPGNPGQTIVQL